MKILITWATWFLWKCLTKQLIKIWHELIVLSRSIDKVHKVFPTQEIWVLIRDSLTQEELEWVEVVIHLAWAPLLRFPWSSNYKKTLYTSRIQTTKKIVEVLPPSCHSFLCASATWYYPNSLTTIYDETYINSSPVSLLENICVDREHEASLAQTANRRIVCLRTWIVEWEQWFLPVITWAINRCMGMIPWTWKQWISTINKEEWIEKILHIIDTPSIQWPINMVTHSQSLETYMKSIAKKLNRPLLFRIPSKLIKFALWEFSSIILSSQYIKTQKTSWWLNQIIEDSMSYNSSLK